MIFYESVVLIKKVKCIEEKIKLLRNQMHKLLHKNKSLTAKEVINISQKLDKTLNQYHKFKK